MWFLPFYFFLYIYTLLFSREVTAKFTLKLYSAFNYFNISKLGSFQYNFQVTIVTANP